MTTISDLTRVKPTHSYSTRLHCCRLAELAIYWHSQGQLPRSSSELIRLSCEALATSLVQNTLTPRIDDLEIAMETLRRYGMSGQLQPKNLHLEGLSLERLGEGPRPDAPARLTSHNIPQEDFSRALDEMESRMLKSSPQKAEQEQVQQFKNALGIIPAP